MSPNTINGVYVFGQAPKTLSVAQQKAGIDSLIAQLDAKLAEYKKHKEERRA
ncbi:hypothetical protein [Bacillus sp. NPDC077027]|uniref:hypothetical protein n=1 Tax=Bacillus sp. NPDC077027 TaxID=3390548 RepID=UPI003D00E9D8